MSVLVLPEIHGLGTPQAESLLSVLHRTADIHQVHLRDVLALMNSLETGGTGRLRPVSCYKSPAQFVGHSSSIERLTVDFHPELSQ